MLFRSHRDLRREVGDCRHRRCSPGRRPDASRRNARSSLAATDDCEVRAECGERLCRRQSNAIGGTRDQDLLVVHGTAIEGYGGAPLAGEYEQRLLARLVRFSLFATDLYP